jgi:periplasmic copper chaperone A
VGLKGMQHKLLFMLMSFWGSCSHTYGQEALQINLSHPIVRAAKAGQNSAAFGVIENHSANDLKLISASTPIADKVELHRSFEEQGIQKMRPVDFIAIKAGEKAVLESGGLHIMLFNLKLHLEDTPDHPQEVPITLVFDSGDKVEEIFLVTKGGVPCH